MSENILDNLTNKMYVIKPTISGSGDNTYLVNPSTDMDIPNTVKIEEVIGIYRPMLESNNDCRIMIQPFISEINRIVSVVKKYLGR